MLDTLANAASNVGTRAKLLFVPRRSVTNDEADWNVFASDWYYAHNYANLRDDDQEIVRGIRDFFAGAGLTGARGVDVGSGTNLYPALAMLPFCRTIELREYSAPNVAWLKRNTRTMDTRWAQFWSVYRENPEYLKVTDPVARLAKLARVKQASVFDLPERRYDVGTMCFLACSLSTDMNEFRRAVTAFLRSLRPGAPFAATFMERSEGYLVDGVRFPAVSIESSDVEEALAPLAYCRPINRITTRKPLREGYNGAMILATGRVRG
jgi:hypothetical protein